MGAEQILIAGCYHPDKPTEATRSGAPSVASQHDRNHIDDIIDIEDKT